MNIFQFHNWRLQETPGLRLTVLWAYEQKRVVVGSKAARSQGELGLLKTGWSAQGQWLCMAGSEESGSCWYLPPGVFWKHLNTSIESVSDWPCASICSDTPPQWAFPRGKNLPSPTCWWHDLGDPQREAGSSDLPCGPCLSPLYRPGLLMAPLGNGPPRIPNQSHDVHSNPPSLPP